MVLKTIFILLSVLYFVVSYFIGIKKNLNFVSFFMLGFTEGLVEKKNKDKVAKLFGILSLVVAIIFLILGIVL